MTIIFSIYSQLNMIRDNNSTPDVLSIPLIIQKVKIIKILIMDIQKIFILRKYKPNFEETDFSLSFENNLEIKIIDYHWVLFINRLMLKRIIQEISLI